MLCYIYFRCMAKMNTDDPLHALLSNADGFLKKQLASAAMGIDLDVADGMWSRELAPLFLYS